MATAGTAANDGNVVGEVANDERSHEHAGNRTDAADNGDLSERGASGSLGGAEEAVVGVADLNAVSELVGAHENDIGNSGGSDGGIGNGELSKSAGAQRKRSGALDGVIETESDRATDRDGSNVGLGNVGIGEVVGGVAVGVVEKHVVRLIQPLSKRQVGRSRRQQSHGGDQHDVDRHKGAKAQRPRNQLTGFRMKASRANVACMKVGSSLIGSVRLARWHAFVGADHVGGVVELSSCGEEHAHVGCHCEVHQSTPIG
jgi:hypothetical protein